MEAGAFVSQLEKVQDLKGLLKVFTNVVTTPSLQEKHFVLMRVWVIMQGIWGYDSLERLLRYSKRDFWIIHL